MSRGAPTVALGRVGHSALLLAAVAHGASSGHYMQKQARLSGMLRSMLPASSQTAISGCSSTLAPGGLPYSQVQFKPPLSAREAQFLQDISADRPPGY